ncbi:tRNA-dihydrouridine(16/17) synthase [NAD(P)(+)]-like [Halotydeus destructor]|nr:tRNA-dihydrouridine(16/17) synthase [NAD(P)(+)]-like [Halotydeus destructor]
MFIMTLLDISVQPRHKPWPQVADFLNSLEDGSIVADIGCGNGKYHQVNKSIELIGCDTSRPLLDICFERHMETVECSCSELPFKANAFDAAISIAVIHHLATDERRLNAMKQIVDLLVVGGQALIYVWAFEQQDKKGKTSNYVKASREDNKTELSTGQDELKSNLANLPVHCNRTSFEQQDVLVPWKNKQDPNQTKLRYYHVFKENELESLVNRLNLVTIVRSYYDQGYDFYREKLKSAKFICAPMVDGSELAFRLLCRKYNVQLAYTPMLNASLFVKDHRYRKDNLQTMDSDRPLIVQFCCDDADTFLEAARLAADHCDAIDLNLGCPQNIAKRGHYGAFLQDEWELLHSMVKKVHDNLDIPVTCKIRVFPELDKTIRYARMLESAGCQLLTVHGRTREQKGISTGLADWQFIKAVKESVSIPVFANGNIQSRYDAERCLSETGVDGIMSAEGLLHNPALFTNVHYPVWQVASEYLELVKNHPCPMSFIRGHLFKILHHCLVVESNQDIRAMVAKAHTADVFEEAVTLLKARHVLKEDQNIEVCTFPVPYYLCQPYFRPLEPIEERNHESERHGAVKRPLDENGQLEDSLEMANGPDGQVLSKNKLKKMEKYRTKKLKDVSGRKNTPLCLKCPNPRGTKCSFELCKKCCVVNCYTDHVDCEGHRFKFKERPLSLESNPCSVDC